MKEWIFTGDIDFNGDYVITDGLEHSNIVALVEDKDNAKLIAVAPELLEVCKEALKELLNKGYFEGGGIPFILKQAIDKAEGK